ncbi:TPA: phage tail assembly protein, partial [Klebsiella pneumoniae]|nr:phage tail assembly protein [Klebsiella pneumoniae]
MSEKTVATVKLDSPITRGDATITEIVLRKPQSGALRGTRLQAVMEMDVASMMTVIPRISTPTLTPQEMADLDPADLAAMSIEVVLFL